MSSRACSLPFFDVEAADDGVTLAAWPSHVPSAIVLVQPNFIVGVEYEEETRGVRHILCTVLIMYCEGPEILFAGMDLWLK